MTDMLLLVISVLSFTFWFLEVNRKKDFKMGLNNATVIIVMQEFDKTGEVYYVNQIHNPDSTLASPNYFADTIFTSETYSDRKKAVERALELEEFETTSRGILIYDALSSYTYGEILNKMDSKVA